MTVEILRLAGLESAEAEKAASTLLDLRTGPLDLRNLLVLDDTDLLIKHTPVFERLDMARRVEDLLCVAVGPRARNARLLEIPGNLGGTQGSPVLWVGDPVGIDWRVAAAAAAMGHPPGKASGLDYLVELLRIEDMFTSVYRTLIDKVPGRIASPGLHLAGADDEASTFAAALAAAIRRLCDPGTGVEGPFPALLPSQAGGATLADGGSLARRCGEVAESVTVASGILRKLVGLTGMFRSGDSRARACVTQTGVTLTSLRDLVARLLQEANAHGELTGNQRQLILDAGIRFPARAESPSAPLTAGQSLVYRTIASSIRSGDSLALVTRRLTLTERELQRRGSASYLHEVGERCPPPLLGRLADPPRRFPRRLDATGVGRDLGLDDALRAAQALGDLVVAVANREWSPAAVSPGEAARIRVALHGVREALTGYADTVNASRGPHRARLTLLAERLTPVLYDLVLRVLANESAEASMGGQEAFDSARTRAVSLLTDWIRLVGANGVSVQPPFAASIVSDAVPYLDEGAMAEIRDALLYPSAREMWQLCAQGDLGMLSVSAPPEAVRFAPRLNKNALGGTLPGDQPVWTSTGSYAGLLRLVPLRSGFAASIWAESGSVVTLPSATEPP